MKKVKCSCDIKTKINYDYKFNKNEFFKNFIDIKNIANINIIKCYKVVLNLKNLKVNYGFLIIGFIMLLYIITIFIDRFKSYKKIKNDLSYISTLKIDPEIINNETSTELILKNQKKKEEKK